MEGGVELEANWDEEPKKPDGFRERFPAGVSLGVPGVKGTGAGARASAAALRRRLVVPFDFVVPERAEQTTTTRF